MNHEDHHIFLHIGLVLLISFSDAILLEEIVQNELWDGVGAYIAVERQFIQDKLDAFRTSDSTACNRPKLFLPEKPVFPDILEDNQHVVYLAVGYWQFHDFESYSHSRYSYPITIATVIIPLLTDNPKGIPHYSLPVAVFYDEDVTDFPKPNMAYPHIPIEEITLIDNRFVMQNGTDEMVLLLKNTDPCKPELPVARHEFDKFAEQEFQLALSEPDFSFCDRHPIDNHFCKTAKRIRCAVSRSYPNVCQTSWRVLDRETCQAKMEFVNVSAWFRDVMLLPDDPINLVRTEVRRGNFTIGLKYPCVENRLCHVGDNSL